METNDVIFDRYYANQRMRTATGDCSGDCKTNLLCSLVATTSESFLACLLHTMGVDIDTNMGELEMDFLHGSTRGTASVLHMSLMAALWSAIAAIIYLA